MTHYGWKDFTWKKNDLIFKGKKVVGLVPSSVYPNMYHLQFSWRDEPTPEFFNLTNARENARRFAQSRASNGDLDDQQSLVEAH